MKKQCLLFITLVTLFSISAVAQTVQTDSVKVKPLSFLRFSPLALFQREFRLGGEIRTFSRQALIIDALLTIPSESKRLNYQEGGGVQTDYHFYFTDKADKLGKTRWYVGLGAMYKWKSLDKIAKTPDFLRFSEAKNQNTYGGHLKLGIDIQMEKKEQSRLEVFGGIGFQYKSIRESPTGIDLFGDKSLNWEYKAGGMQPRFLFGIVFKMH